MLQILDGVVIHYRTSGHQHSSDEGKMRKQEGEASTGDGIFSRTDGGEPIERGEKSHVSEVTAPPDMSHEG